MIIRTLARIVKPLKSRKVRVALATVAAGFAVEYGLDVSEELMLIILGSGTAIILGIAHEDAGSKSRSQSTTTVHNAPKKPKG
jgi:hypothetical protein